MAYDAAMYIAQSNAISGMLAVLVIGLMIGFMIYVMYKYVQPATRYQNYLQSYKIGRLTKHAKEKGIDFVFEKAPRSELQIIDDGFEKEVRIIELDEIESSKGKGK